ncbi:hypothetical protein JYU34_009629 [Plutella xylostella]|uniref:Uncharacterized protein n=1 Tax=Plutella xylostella TaxID=51655 RepID=A0ABQ7QK09_PLUXY|nr:hypothetical protein JYU34_009629 [Plutella xylostella]
MWLAGWGGEGEGQGQRRWNWFCFLYVSDVLRLPVSLPTLPPANGFEEAGLTVFQFESARLLTVSVGMFYTQYKG